MSPTKVEANEALYRAIRSGSDEYVRADGALRFTVLAFADRECKPSVDRSSIRTDPLGAKKSSTDGVTQLITHQVRAICDIKVSPDKKGDTAAYAIDAIHDPIEESETEPENHAHCRVVCSPEVKVNHFNKRVREALANVATSHGFVIDPT
jgi:hypothetical protein